MTVNNNIIGKALEHFVLYLQIYEQFDGDIKLQEAKKCLAYVDQGGIVDYEWITDKKTILNESIRVYVTYLENRISEKDFGFSGEKEVVLEELKFLKKIEHVLKK